MGLHTAALMLGAVEPHYRQERAVRRRTIRMTTMTRPFSNAETTFMPELHPRTEPLPRLSEGCHYCGIRLSAVPDHPRAYITPEGVHVHCHPGCVGAQRIKDAGLSTVLP
jgi:hypothetical protein